MSGPAVIFVFFILFATGLTFPMKRIRQKQANDRTASTASESDSSTVTVIEVSVSNEQEKILEPSVGHVKRTDPLGDRLLNKIKERSLVKIIKRAKRPRYKLRESLLEHDLFSVAGQDSNNNTVTFHEIFNSVKPSLSLANNLTTGENIPNMDNKIQLINTYLPLKSLSNGSDIEIIQNTVLSSKALSNTPEINKSTNNISDKWDQSSAKRNLKHQVRKYFRLHNSIAKELEARSVMYRPNSESSRSSNSEATAVPALKIDHGSYGLAKTPRTQSIVLRWNLILV